MTKDTNTATNSETRDQEVYRTIRDKTQKNADALYESNNEEEESKDVMDSQLPMGLASIDKRIKTNNT